MYDIVLNIYTSLTWVVPFLVVLTVLVFFHELGHYLSARRHGVKVTTFSIGFGRELFGFTDKVGTRWKFSLIPLGGYVQMFGDADPSSRPDSDLQASLSAEELQHTLNSKKVWQRIEVSAAGPMANLLLTALFLTIVFWQAGQKSIEPILGEILPQSAAAKAGLQAHDRILAISDTPIDRFRQVQIIASKNAGKLLAFKIQRQNEVMVVPVTPDSQELSPNTIIGTIGAGPPEVIHHTSFFSAITSAFTSTFEMSVDMLKMFGHFITGKEDRSQLGSLFSIAKMSHDMWQGGLFSLLFFMAILSLNLGVINLLPVPMLDGGHIFIYLIEAIRGKTLDVRTQEWIFRIGFGIVGFVMLYTLWNDIVRFALFQKVYFWVLVGLLIVWALWDKAVNLLKK
jgi:regulator of sigma E protease